MDAIRRRKWLIVVTMALTLIIGAVYTLRQKPVYESKALLVLATNQPIPGRADDLGLLSDLLALTKSRTMQSQLEIIASQETIESAVRELGVEALWTGFRSRSVPEWALSVDGKKESDVLTITTRAYSPTVAADLANLIVDAYMEHDQNFSNNAARQARQYIASELDSVRKQLDATQKELADYKRKTRLVAADEQLRAIAGNMLSLEMERDRADVELASAEQQAEQLRGQLESEGTEVLQSTTIQLSPQYQEALSTLAKLNAQRATLIQEYTPESVEVKKVDGEIAQAEQRMKQVTQDIVSAKVLARNPVLSSYVNALVTEAGANARLQAIASVISNRNREVESLPEQERTVAKLMHRAAILERTFESLSDKYYNLMINEKSSLPIARMASAARPTSIPVSPNKRKNAVLFLFLALMLSAGVTTVAECKDKRIRDEASVTELTGMVPLSMIPEQRLSHDFTIDDLGFDGPFMESLRMLNNVLSYSEPHQSMKIIAVTSPGHGEGKSTISVSLAAAMAMSGKKVLVVDCDLRNPTAHKYMNLSGDIGLSNLLKGAVAMEKAVQSAKLQNLYCLPAGPLPPNPAELLSSAESRKVFDKLRDSYDVVLMDGPHCAGLSDMQVVSSIADGTLLVVSIDYSQRSHLQSSVFSLEQVNAPYLGMVVNRLSNRRVDTWYPSSLRATYTVSTALVDRVLAVFRKKRPH